MAQAQQRGNGYIGWSWSGNGGCCTSLDIVTNFSTTLSSWGQILVNGANGIRSDVGARVVFGTPTNNLAVSTDLAVVCIGCLIVSRRGDRERELDGHRQPDLDHRSPTSGNNNGSFTVSATANTGTASRSGAVTRDGRWSHAHHHRDAGRPDGQQPDGVDLVTVAGVGGLVSER